MSSITQNFSRRELLKTCATGGCLLLLGALGAPSDARADETNNQPEVVYIINPEVERLWNEALAEAAANPVDLSQYQSDVSVAKYLSAYGEVSLGAGFGWANLVLYASLSVASNNVINSVNGMQWTVGDLRYAVESVMTDNANGVILDGGRTRAYHYTIGIKGVPSGTISVVTAYVEIYYTGAISITI